MKMSIIIMMSFFASLHPISMIMTMILMTIYISFNIYLYLKTSWLPFIIILLMLGGMLVIFLYITSLTPNKKFNFKSGPFILFLPLCLFFPKSNFLPSAINKMDIFNIFNQNNIMFLIIMMLYLILALLVIMSLILASFSPLKSN
uniref:NADH dehydrogenase subunit 6 n=1 Tax=Ornithodoros zumpti TaxID=1827026 RepID=A0A1P8AGD2_9ACAR|nr:NADH dehydrogenase subunit 6 [Ornithodoros zumpti]AMX74180.1 NADH dehydrogenase subunit 6 [Ornithodoros zumpti]UYB78779.1 NADH dehydrogenase subunit 6 [Ornithodoros zumpti]